MNKLLLPIICIPSSLLLSGCLSVPLMTLNSGDKEKKIPESEQTAIKYAPTPGSIYLQDGVSQLDIYGDHRARNVGDLLTIVLQETTSAQVNSSTSTSKDSSIELDSPTLLGKTPTWKGRDVLNNQSEASRTFDGSGDSSQSNSLSGNLTVTVTRRLGNGNLVVRGEKNLQLNQGSEYIRVEGVIRQADISRENTVLSSAIADARITYRGKGTLAQSNTPGMLSRFFNSPIYPY